MRTRPRFHLLVMHRHIPLATLLAVLAVAAPAHALRAPAPTAAVRARPELDTRDAQRTPVPSAVRAARAALARRLGIEGHLAADPVGGGVRVLGRTDGFLSAPASGDAAAVALAYVREHANVFGLDTTDLAALRLRQRSRSDDGVTHLTWVPLSDGVPAYDSKLRVHVSADGRVISATGPPLGGLALASATPRLSPSEALGAAQRDVGARMTFPAASTRAGVQRPTTFTNGDRAQLVAFAAPRGDRLAWRITVAGTDPYVYDELVDASSGALLARHSLTRFAANADVFENHPGAAAGGIAHTVDLAPWISAPGTALSGPNAHAYADVNGSDSSTGQEIAPSSGSDFQFPQVLVSPASGEFCSPFGAGICTWDGNAAAPASEATNRAQATTQVFYYVNTYHDWLQQPAIGFDDASGNFEVGGSGGSDPVLAEADDAIQASNPSLNNANMSTPPDGQSPTMQMYLFDDPFPAVNGGDDASVVYHEYTHGLSGRLVNDGDGLNAKQSQAMGEGWSDWYAMDDLVANAFVADTGADGEVRVGEYATGDTSGGGIRFQPLDCAVGSGAPACAGSVASGHSGGFTFADLGRVGRFSSGLPSFEVHDDGEIWSETLWDVRKAFGAVTARSLITNAMRLSPPNPSFLDERDAILQADGGTHHDELWQLFAARGMGYGARTSSANATQAKASFATPALAAVASTSLTDPAPLGDGDGVPEPGDGVQLHVRLANPALVNLTGVHATLASGTAGVVVDPAPADYGSIGAGGSGEGVAPFAVTLPSSLACGSHVPFTLSVTSDQGAIALPVDLALGSGRSVFSATNVPRAIPDAAPGTGVISTLTVPTAGRIDQLRVTLSVSHTWIGDVRVRLTSPGGTSVDLVDRPGTADDGSQRNGLAAVTLDDAAGQTIQDIPIGDGPAVSGTFAPDGVLAAFNGEDRAGVWTLRATDAAQGDVGSVTAWSLDTDEPACAAGGSSGGGGGSGGGGSGGSGGSGSGSGGSGGGSATPPHVTKPKARASVSHRTARARLGRHALFTFAFRALPARTNGTVSFTLPRTRHTRALRLGATRFTVSGKGRAQVVIAARGAALTRLRHLGRVKVAVRIRLGGRVFSSVLRLAAR